MWYAEKHLLEVSNSSSTFFVAASFFFAFSPIHAATPPETVQQLDPVIVEATRDSGQNFRDQLKHYPSSGLLIPNTEIKQSRGYNLEDVFQFAPGVYVQSRTGGTDGKLSIRGTNLSSNFNIWGVTLLINGLPMCTADGLSVLDSIDLLAVDHIEVYKGANALGFGGNTLGGAVNFVFAKWQGRFASPNQGAGWEF